MFEPISAACLYAIGEAAKACTIAGITGGIAGNVADRILCNVTRATTDHFIQNIREPVNHDLLAGMIVAHQRAFLHYADMLDGQATAQDRPIADKIIALAKKDVAFDVASTQALLASVTPLIAGAGDKTMAARRAEFVGAAVTALVAWVEAETRETLPASFIALFTERAPNGRESWEEKFQLYLAETIKDEKRYGRRFTNIFIASNIAELVGRTVTIQELAEGILTSVEALHSKVDAVKDDTSRILAIIEAKPALRPTPELRKPSVILRRKTKQAKIASRRHNAKSAVRLWSEVTSQAEEEGLVIEAMVARLEIALALVRDEGDIAEGLKVAESCVQTAKNIELSRERCRLNQLVGQIYRINGDTDRARGLLHTSLDDAQTLQSFGDEGWALLALSTLDRLPPNGADNTVALERIANAYDAFSRLYASGEEESQKEARNGFAQCHGWKADILGHARPDEVIAEWNCAADILRDLGTGWEWELGDALVHRAKALAGKGEIKSATVDLDEAARQFRSIRNLLGLANCHLAMAEMLDSAGEREKSATLYQQASAIAVSSNNDRRASYFLFRHACKLAEIGQYDQADLIFDQLVNADWLEANQKLDVASQLCSTAEANGSEALLKERVILALAIIKELKKNAKSASDLRSLDFKTAHFFEMLDRYDDAERCYNGILDRLNPTDDAIEIAECWFQIRGLMQRKGDRKREREACENALRIGGDRLNPLYKSIALRMLAQLNVEEERYGEAKSQLDLANDIDPSSPIAGLIGGHLQSKLPKLSSNSNRSKSELAAPSDFDLPHFIRELHRWTKSVPKKKNSILSVWYYIHRHDLWATLKSTLGVKFLIATEHVTIFDKARLVLNNGGDIFVWGLNFSFKSMPAKGKFDLDQIPTVEDYLHPAGVTVVTNHSDDDSSSSKFPVDSDMLTPARSASGISDVSYFLAPVLSETDPRGFSTFYFGRKQRWSDNRITKFMLGRSADELIAQCAICLPLSETVRPPSLQRVMQVAFDNMAIPVFIDRLPSGAGVASICDGKFDLPTENQVRSAHTKALWETLLDSCATASRQALNEFLRGMSDLCGPDSSPQRARIYALRFTSESGEAIHPALVILGGATQV